MTQPKCRTKVTTLTLDIRTQSEANLREHWATKARRAKLQRVIAKVSVANLQITDTGGDIRITLTRIAPRSLDSDNLARAFKAIRDGIADALKVNDGSSRIQWEYQQEKGGKGKYQVRIEIRMA